MTAQLGPAKYAAMPFKAKSICFHHGEWRVAERAESCPSSPRSRRRDGGRGEDESRAVGRHL